jgi:hypothetical protein
MMARDGSNIDKWYKEWLKGLTNPTGARGWQPDEVAQDWVNNAIEKIFGKGSARQTAYTIGNRGMTLPPETGGYQTNPLGNALVASPWSSSMLPGADGSWEPELPTGYGNIPIQQTIPYGSPTSTDKVFMPRVNAGQSWEPDAMGANPYFKIDDFGNPRSTYYGWKMFGLTDLNAQRFVDSGGQEMGALNRFGQPVGTPAPLQTKGPRGSGSPYMGNSVGVPLENGGMAWIMRKNAWYRQARQEVRDKRKALRKMMMPEDEGWGVENAASGTGTGWSW